MNVCLPAVCHGTGIYSFGCKVYCSSRNAQLSENGLLQPFDLTCLVTHLVVQVKVVKLAIEEDFLCLAV